MLIELIGINNKKTLGESYFVNLLSESDFKRRQKIAKILNISLVILASGWAVLTYLLEQPISLSLALIASLFFLISIVLQQYKFYTVSRLIAVYTYIIIMLVGDSVTGVESKINSTFVVTIALPFLIFSWQLEKKYIYLVAGSSVIAWLITVLSGHSLLPIREVPSEIALSYYSIASDLTIFISIGWVMYFFINEVMHAEKLSDDYQVVLQQEVQERTQQLHHQAHNDSLTNLPNRLSCLQFLETMIAIANQHNRRFAVMFIDLDDFKSINDSMGHEAGDNLLIDAANRLKSSVHSDDFVGRLGGDEFVVILNENTNISNFSLIAEKIVSSFQNSFNVGERHFSISTSIGISIYPSDGQTASVILSNADTAMYYSKNIGRNVYSFFTEAMNQEVEIRRKYIEHLHGALERGEIECHYQPKVSLPSLDVIGFEVLARWNNPELGQVSPSDFIPVAESTGMIIPICQFIYEESLIKLSKLQSLFSCNFTMSINLSPVQFRDTELVKWVRSGAEKCNIDYNDIELEITEGVLLNEYDYVINALSELTSLGIRISLDDFGTGYSSMSYLRKYPFSSLKIDREFIRDMAEDNSDKKLVKSTINLGRELGMEVIAEGVETKEHLTMLSEMGCHTAQGFLFSKAQPFEKLLDFLNNYSTVNKV